MIIRKTPKNPKDYIIVDAKTSEILHKNGFHPKYMDIKGEKYYYVKTENVIYFIKQNNLIVLE